MACYAAQRLAPAMGELRAVCGVHKITAQGSERRSPGRRMRAAVKRALPRLHGTAFGRDRHEPRDQRTHTTVEEGAVERDHRCGQHLAVRIPEALKCGGADDAVRPRVVPQQERCVECGWCSRFHTPNGYVATTRGMRVSSWSDQSAVSVSIVLIRTVGSMGLSRNFVIGRYTSSISRFVNFAGKLPSVLTADSMMMGLSLMSS